MAIGMTPEESRCMECGAPLTEGGCGNCAPTGRPVDKAERRRLAAVAAHEKELWDDHVVARKRRARPEGGGTT
jgi:hypothetical protein